MMAALALIAGGCSWFKKGDGLAGVQAIPLAPVLRLSPQFTATTIPYQDACGQVTSFPAGGVLAEILPQKLGRVFKGLTVESAQPRRPAPDGAIDVAVGLKQIDLAIFSQAKKRYPVAVSLGVDLVYLADDGTALFSKKLQSVGHGDVDVTGQGCDVTGLEPAVREAVELVSEGLARHLAESIRLKEYAERQKSSSPTAAAPEPSTPAPAPVVPDLPPAPNPAAAPEPPPAGTQPRTAELPSDAGEQAVPLLFKAILRDENRDQTVQPDESLTIEVEVKNNGTAEAKGIEVLLGGTPALTGLFPPSLSIGTLQPGELKRVTSTARIPAGAEPVPCELVLSLRSATPVASVPLDKKFSVLIKPEAATAEAAPDMDQPPKSAVLLKQPKALVVAIGVGRFRDAQVAPVKYAGRDAEVMAAYLRAISGVTDDRVRVLIDAHALKQDLVETFDEWLRKKADPATTVYVFFAGRALVDGGTGAVSLVPFDGTTSSVSRLYSVRRLQESLARAGAQRAILMFDVSLEPAPGADPAATASPVWDTFDGERKDQIMWMVAHKGLQESHAYEPGRHGLFTYHLLRGLQGLADVDRDGTVVAGELCTYARSHTSRVAREFGNEQDPLCVPPPGQGALVRIHPMAKGNNPKPATVKKDEPASAPEPSPKPSADVGPGR